MSSSGSERMRLILFVSFATFLSTLFLSGSEPSREQIRSNNPLSEWAPAKKEPVILHFDDSERYELDTPMGATEWAALLPEGEDGHLIYLHDAASLNPEPDAYTVSLFHQMKCLDIIRDEYANHPELESSPSDLTQHCLNYLRQMVLCRPHVYLESAKRISIQLTSKEYDVVCEDWEAVYEEARRNREAFDGWAQERVPI